MSILNEANGCRAEYLFSNRKVGASYDLGDKTFTCGRRGDALKVSFFKKRLLNIYMFLIFYQSSEVLGTIEMPWSGETWTTG